MEITGAVLRSADSTRPYAVSRPLTIETLHLDDPGPGEVLVRIEVAGLCHSDLSVVDGARPRPLPMLLGHEAAGIVEAAGAGVDPVIVGRRVATTFLPRCGECPECQTDGRLPCRKGSATNAAGTLFSRERRLHVADGDVNHHLGVSGFASHAVVDARSVVVVDDDVPPAVAALCGCAVLTGGGAVLNAAHMTPGDDIIVVGLGGVGMAALLTAVAIADPTTRVIGIDQNTAKLSSATELGATDVYTPADATTLGVTAGIVVEAAGHPRAFETALGAVAAGGVLVTVGLPAPNARAEVFPLNITAKALTIVGSYQGSAVPSRDIPRFIDLWRQGRLPIEALASSHVPLAEINIALDTLADGEAIRQIITIPATDRGVGEDTL